MADAVRSAAARAAEAFAAYIRSLPSASSSSSSSLCTPGCDIDRMQQGAKRLIRTLDAIRARLDDAEKREITDDLVRHWLRELEGVAYEAEDVLDELAYEAMRLGLMEQPGGFTPIKRRRMEETEPPQVRHPSSPTPPHEILAFLNGVVQRMEKIDSSLDEITRYKLALSLEEICGQGRAETPARQPTSSLMHESVIFGRKKDLETVKKFLLSADAKVSTSNSVPVMAIVGMGGLGKTTLAQLAYNDPEIKKHFELRCWVCVSEDFDLVRLTRAMLESISREACHISVLDALQVNLRDKLKASGQKFLLVLDDVWESQNLSSNWGLLMAPLCCDSAEGKIIVTSRSKQVSKMTRATTAHHLPCLQDEDCLMLFNRRAFEGRDPNLHQNLMAIGQKIAKKCRGLPLVAKTLGALLHAIDDEETWNDILGSDVWNMDEENEIMPVLRLSYQHLPPHVKRCFRYCSVFPKNHQFDRDKLVQMWMALGYIQAKGKKLMEDIGNEYFDDLLCRSFFQHSQEHQRFLMHDLIHDLARCVSEGECCSVENDRTCPIPGNVRHFSIVTTCDSTGYIRPAKSIFISESLGFDISELGFLRSFLLFGTPFRWFNYIKLLNDLLTSMQHLRVLDLTTIQLPNLPNSISGLKHLRYLGLPKFDIKRPLHLRLRFQSPQVHMPDRLSDSISSLLNLRHLIYNGNVASVEYPVGIGKLTGLQTMPGFHVSPEGGGSKLGELKHMNNIQGTLVVTGLHHLTDANDAKGACLEKKEHLCALHLRWDEDSYSHPLRRHQYSPLPREQIQPRPLRLADEVLESLKPSPKLERLEISSFYGRALPSWLGDQSLSKLADLKLDSCRNWTSLPNLGRLPSLKCLFIKSARQVSYIGSDFFSGGFPRLEMLTLQDMQGWKSWCGAQKGECPQLRRLHIQSCELLESLSVTNLHALQDLQIKECPKLHFSSGSLQLGLLTSLQEIVVRIIHGVGRIHGVFSCGYVQSLGTSYLELENVDQLEILSVLSECSYVRRLIVARCANLTSLPFGNLKALEYVEISECPLLQFPSGSLPPWQLPSLQEINVRCGVGRINCVSCHGGTQSLELENVGQLEALSVVGECFPIRQLTVAKCDLTSLPLGNLDALQYLRISECPPALTEWCEHNRPRLARLRRLDIEAKGGHSLRLVLQNVLSVHEVVDAPLWKRGSLRSLEIDWDCNIGVGSSADAVVAEEVFKKLHPHRILNKLVIRGYMGLRFPCWLGDPSFSNLFSVTLLRCSQCEVLPPLGQLPNLVKLYVEGAHRLKHITRVFHDVGVGSVNKEGPSSLSLKTLLYKCTSSGVWRRSFPALTKLEFHDMPIWEEWWGTRRSDFSSLCKLTLKHCPKLRALPHLPPTLKELELEACQELVCLSSSDPFTQSLQSLESLRRLSLIECPKLGFCPRENLPSALQYMSLVHCPMLVQWCERNTTRLAHIPDIWIDRVRVFISGDGKSIWQVSDGRDGGERQWLSNASLSRFWDAANP